MERLTPMRRALALFAVGAISLFGCGDDGDEVDAAGSTTSSAAADSEQAQLDGARARWEAAGITDYRWAYRRTCFCPPLTVKVVVADGAVASHEAVPDPAVDPQAPEEVTILTVDDLFDEVQEAIDTADEVTVEYDDETGRVLTVDVDPIANAVDDEYGYAVTHFAVPDGGPPITEAPITDRVALTEHFGCGYGFHASNPEQTVSLRVDFTGAPAALPAVVNLPDPSWDGVVVVGEELYANWCNDVIDPSQPQPHITESWTIMSATIEFVGGPPATDGAGGGSPVTARITDVVAERPDGSNVELPDLEVTNESWGMFAG